MRSWLARLCGTRGSFVLRRAPASILLRAGKVRTPSEDYFLSGWGGRARHVEDALAREAPGLADGDRVLILRYLGPAWRARLEAMYRRLDELVYFMDDDLLDPAALDALPRDYARKIRRHACDHADWLAEHCTEIWVSTQALADKYVHLNPRLVTPRPRPELLARVEPLRIGYHGTASHRAEIEWLREVLVRVLQAVPYAQFEIFGDHSIKRLMHDLPRVKILHPMNWPDYLAYTSAARLDIGLAPLLPGRFNSGRGVVKFFDYARMGAAGLYSDCLPFSGFINHDKDGLLLPNEVERWVGTIIGLAWNGDRRRELASRARARAEAMTRGPA